MPSFNRYYALALAEFLENMEKRDCKLESKTVGVLVPDVIAEMTAINLQNI
jgi:hypothetical protein